MNSTKQEPIHTNDQPLRYFHFITIVFVVVLLLSNIASSAKIVDWGISLFKLPLAFDAGTLLFPISYIFGDVLTEVYGYKRTRKVIWTGFACLAFSAIVFWLVRILPGEAYWEQSVGQASYNAILGGMSSGGLVIASILGYLTGSFSNALVMAVLKPLTRGRLLWLRTISSTLVGEFIDTAIFIVIASLTFVFPWSIFWSLIITNYIFKVGIEVVMTPLTYSLVNHLKKVENIDVFDKMDDLNPFSLKS